MIHRDYNWLGGSPDGITTDGILLEVKCPVTRKIVMGEVPHHYLSQVLLNLEICDLEIAHFIEFIPGNSDTDFIINIVEVKRDREWFSKELIVMKKFWDDVLFYRKEGIHKHPKFRPPRQKKPKEQGITINIDIKTSKCLNKLELLDKLLNRYEVQFWRANRLVLQKLYACRVGGHNIIDYDLLSVSVNVNIISLWISHDDFSFTSFQSVYRFLIEGRLDKQRLIA